MTQINLDMFQRLATLDLNVASAPKGKMLEDHPFDQRNIHSDLWATSKALFDDGYFSQATFEAYKHIDLIVKSVSGKSKTGYKLMMEAFNPDKPDITIADTSNMTGKDVQKGYQFLFSGGVMAIRNPRGHEVDYPETIDDCLDNLSFASMLLRQIDNRLT